MHAINSRNASNGLKSESTNGKKNGLGPIGKRTRNIDDARKRRAELNRLESELAKLRKDFVTGSDELRSIEEGVANTKAVFSELASRLPSEELIGKVDAAFMAMEKRLACSVAPEAMREGPPRMG